MKNLPIGPFPDFDACVAHMMKPKEEGGGGYDENTARKVCGKMKAELEESFSWAGDIKSYPGAKLIRGEAIHPIKTLHPNEWPSVRIYLEEELKKSAETFRNKPLYLDHWRPLNGKVLGVQYEDGALEYVANLEDEDVLRMIRDRQIKHASVQFEWKSLENVNGVAPRGITFEHLSLLKDMEPGDPLSTVEVWEKIAHHLKEAKEYHPGKLEDYLDWQLIKDRTIIFHGQVSEDVCKEASKKLEYLKGSSKEPIKIILNSVGGDVYDGLLVFDTIKKITDEDIPVICEARGLAASMGCIILQAGTKRLATDHTRFLIHEVSSFAWGKASDVEEQSEELKKVNNMLKEILSERTGKTPEEIEKVWHKKDVWMSAEEAKKFGLIDDIIKEARSPPPNPQGSKAVKIKMNEKEFRESLKKYPEYTQATYLKLLEAKVPLGSLAKLLEAEWDTDYINNLPDSAFAYIEPGGEKDEQGKTVPRSLRHFPYKNAQGNLSPDHVRNGLARLGQDLGDWATADAKAQIKKKLCAAAKELEIESEVCGLEEQAGEEPEKDEHGCVIGKQRWDEESQTCVPIPPTQEQQGEEPEKDEHGCIIGKERYDEEQDKCVPITAEARISFLETSLKLKEQAELTIEEIKQKIVDLNRQKAEIDVKLYPEAELTEEERAEFQAQLDILWAEIEAYEQALAAKIAGGAAPPPPAEVKEQQGDDHQAFMAKCMAAGKTMEQCAAEWKEQHPEEPPTAGEAIIPPTTPKPPALVVSVEKLEGILPSLQAERSMSWGAQRFVQEVKQLIREAKKGGPDSG